MAEVHCSSGPVELFLPRNASRGIVHSLTSGLPRLPVLSGLPGKLLAVVKGRLYRSAELSFETQDCPMMTGKTVDLDQHRGIAAQKATEVRRLLADVDANEKALRHRQAELESQLLAAPATNWQDAADKARYLLDLFAAAPAGQDPRRKRLIAAVLADFNRLSDED